jgi:hypothetical protein
MPTDNDHQVGPHDVDDGIPAQLRAGQRDWLQRWVHLQVLSLEVPPLTSRITSAGEYPEKQMFDLSAMSLFIAKERGKDQKAGFAGAGDHLPYAKTLAYGALRKVQAIL